MALSHFWQLIQAVSIFLNFKLFSVAHHSRKLVKSIQASKPWTIPPPRIPEIPADYCLNTNDTTGILDQLFAPSKIAEKIVEKVVVEVVHVPNEVATYEPPPRRTRTFPTFTHFTLLFIATVVIYMIVQYRRYAAELRREAERARRSSEDTQPKSTDNVDWESIIQDRDEKIRLQNEENASLKDELAKSERSKTVLENKVQLGADDIHNLEVINKQLHKDLMDKDSNFVKTTKYKEMAIKMDHAQELADREKQLEEQFKIETAELIASHEATQAELLAKELAKQKTELEEQHKKMSAELVVSHEAVQAELSAKELAKQKKKLEENHRKMSAKLAEQNTELEEQKKMFAELTESLETTKAELEEKKADLRGFEMVAEQEDESLAKAKKELAEVEEEAARAKQEADDAYDTAKKLQDEFDKEKEERARKERGYKDVIARLQKDNNTLRDKCTRVKSPATASSIPSTPVFNFNSKPDAATTPSDQPRRSFTFNAGNSPSSTTSSSFSTPKPPTSYASLGAGKAKFTVGSTPFPDFNLRRSSKRLSSSVPESPKEKPKVTLPVLPLPKPSPTVSGKQIVTDANQKKPVPASSTANVAPTPASVPALSVKTTADAAPLSATSQKGGVEASKWADTPTASPKATIQQPLQRTPTPSTVRPSQTLDAQLPTSGASEDGASKLQPGNSDAKESSIPQTTDNQVTSQQAPTNEQKIEVDENLNQSITAVTRSVDDKSSIESKQAAVMSEIASHSQPKQTETASKVSREPLPLLQSDKLEAFHIPLIMPKHDERGIEMPKLVFDVSAVPANWQPRRSGVDGRIRQWNRSELQTYNRQRKSKDKKDDASVITILVWIDKENTDPQEKCLFYQEFSWDADFSSNAAVQPVPIKQTPFHEYVQSKFGSQSGQQQPGFGETRLFTCKVGLPPPPAMSAPSGARSAATSTPTTPASASSFLSSTLASLETTEPQQPQQATGSTMQPPQPAVRRRPGKNPTWTGQSSIKPNYSKQS